MSDYGGALRGLLYETNAVREPDVASIFIDGKSTTHQRVEIAISITVAHRGNSVVAWLVASAWALLWGSAVSPSWSCLSQLDKLFYFAALETAAPLVSALVAFAVLG